MESLGKQNELTLLRAIPALTNHFDIVSDISSSWSKCGIDVLTLDLTFWDIPWQSIWHSLWHSIRHLFWHSIVHHFWHLSWHLFSHSFWRSIWHLPWHSIWCLLSRILSTIWLSFCYILMYSNTLSDIVFGHSSWRLHSIWHSTWHSVWHLSWHPIWHPIWHSTWHSFMCSCVRVDACPDWAGAHRRARVRAQTLELEAAAGAHSEGVKEVHLW